MEREQDNKFLG